MRDEKVGRNGSPGDAVPVANRMRSSLRKATTGCLFAVVGSVAAVVTCLSVPGTPGLVWALAVTALVGMLAMAGICALQGWLWRTAISGWRRQRRAGLVAYMPPSWVSHLASYPIALAGVVANAWLFVSLTNFSTAWWSALVSCVCLVAAQASGAVEFLRLSGPSGSVPMHLRRLTHRGANR